MTEEQLLDVFGNQGLAPFNLADLIDRDKLARNDYFYFKQGVEVERERILKFLDGKSLTTEDIIDFIKAK